MPKWEGSLDHAIRHEFLHLRAVLHVLLLSWLRLARVCDPADLALSEIGFKQPADQQLELEGGFFIFRPHFRCELE